MRLFKLQTWDEQIQDDDTNRKDELNQQILKTYTEIEKYETWEGLEDYIREEQRKEFINIMNADGEHLIMARERARVYSKILQRKADLEEELARLHSERNSLEE